MIILAQNEELAININAINKLFIPFTADPSIYADDICLGMYGTIHDGDAEKAKQVLKQIIDAYNDNKKVFKMPK